MLPVMSHRPYQITGDLRSLSPVVKCVSSVTSKRPLAPMAGMGMAQRNGCWGDTRRNFKLFCSVILRRRVCGIFCGNILWNSVAWQFTSWSDIMDVRNAAGSRSHWFPNYGAGYATKGSWRNLKESVAGSCDRFQSMRLTSLPQASSGCRFWPFFDFHFILIIHTSAEAAKIAFFPFTGRRWS
jgi:hypothetical protein